MFSRSSSITCPLCLLSNGDTLQKSLQQIILQNQLSWNVFLRLLECCCDDLDVRMVTRAQEVAKRPFPMDIHRHHRKRDFREGGL